MLFVSYEFYHMLFVGLLIPGLIGSFWRFLLLGFFSSLYQVLRAPWFLQSTPLLLVVRPELLLVVDLHEGTPDPKLVAAQLALLPEEILRRRVARTFTGHRDRSDRCPIARVKRRKCVVPVRS